MRYKETSCLSYTVTKDNWLIKLRLITSLFPYAVTYTKSLSEDGC